MTQVPFGQIAPISRRAIAYLIDALIAGGIAVVLTIVLVISANLTGSLEGAAGVLLIGGPLVSLVLLGWFVFYTFMQAGAGSIGMRAQGLRLISEDGTPLGFGRTLLRNVIFGLAAGIVVGYFTPLFDGSGRFQGWHDKVAKSLMMDARAAGAPGAANTARPVGAQAGPPVPGLAAPGVPPVPAGTGAPVAYGVQAPPVIPGIPVPPSVPAAPGAPVAYAGSAAPAIPFGAPPVPQAPPTGAEWPAPQVPAAPQPAPQSAPQSAPQMPGRARGSRRSCGPRIRRAGGPAPLPQRHRRRPLLPPHRSRRRRLPLSTMTGSSPTCPVSRWMLRRSATLLPRRPRRLLRPAPAAPVIPAAPAFPAVPPAPAFPAAPAADVSAAASAPEPSADVLDDDLEETRISIPGHRLVFTWDDGTRVTVSRRTVFGRNPSPEDGVTVVPVRDETLSLSKTHFEAAASTSGGWVLDRFSTNGMTLVREGQRIACPAGQRVPIRLGDAIEIGDRIVTIGGYA